LSVAAAHLATAKTDAASCALEQGIPHMYLSRPSLHSPVTTLLDHKTAIESAFSSTVAMRRRTERVAGPALGSLQIPLTTVSLSTNFDAYIDIWFKGSPADSSQQLLLDSGNSVLIVPRWEDIAALPNAGADYKVLGAGFEPWGCPANIVRGPIDLVTAGGATHTIQDCTFYACTGDPPSGGQRTANFGAGCLDPWTASGWNTPLGADTPALRAPLGYDARYPFAEFVYAAPGAIYGDARAPKVASGSYVNLLTAQPDGYVMYAVIAGKEWMALPVKALSIGATKTGWPGAVTSPIAMIDTGGGPVFLSDPNGYLHGNPWPDPVPNPQWVSTSVDCESISDDITIELGDAATSVSYKIDPSLLPSAARGLTLVMCKMNSYMMGQQGMNIGGISALVNYILVDYQRARVGIKPK
jgi:hypothetical protein